MNNSKDKVGMSSSWDLQSGEVFHGDESVMVDVSAETYLNRQLFEEFSVMLTPLLAGSGLSLYGDDGVAVIIFQEDVEDVEYPVASISAVHEEPNELFVAVLKPNPIHSTDFAVDGTISGDNRKQAAVNWIVEQLENQGYISKVKPPVPNGMG